jgi:hypothetical protein
MIKSSKSGLVPVAEILATAEAEIKRSQFEANRGKKNSPDPVWKITSRKKDWWSGSSCKVPV